MSLKPLRWGLLGAGRIARKFVAALHTIPHAATPAVVASRDADRATAFVSETGVLRYTTAYEELLQDPEVDAIYISLPNQLHAAWAMQAIQAGKHVLCEKPLTTDLNDALALNDAAEQQGVVLLEGFMYRFHPQTLRLQQLLAEGQIGKVTSLRVAFGFFLDRPTDPRWDPALGGGALWDVGSYSVNLARMVSGVRPSHVYASALWSESKVDQLLNGMLTYPNGMIAQISCGFINTFHQSLQINGDDGLIDLERPFNLPPDHASTIRLWKGRSFAPLEQFTLPETNHYASEAYWMAEYVAGVTTTNPMPMSETIDNLATILALYESARTQQVVVL